ncbi:FAD-dependent oxidoreductase [Novosphingobium album (ex Liu et al. 2023)]|uniref:FAD-dependent oxidoreductase n=1 Tax=Novosphingobium album (ex Liu et al. 2023) TaxID=3031130 RepID=A0ABT5WSK9_9SPHN|nr:FAD-dependent oxidoreductase [Novosphingobium album (ex Liu et al. 2023)]MDE8652980.1 FAD-dependent oxidoreductase [Novosphingobium album (ex Liu et al. 2023)]
MAHEYDVIIVGSGAGGMAAAITAKLSGLRPLLIEKTAQLGGSSVLSGGVLWMPNNPLLAREGVPDSREAGLRYLANFVEEGDPCSSPARREAFVDAVPAVIALLEAQGMRYERCPGYADYYSHLPGGHAASRSLQAALFNANRLGSWKARLRAPSLPLPIRTSEGAQLMRVGFAWDGKAMAARIAARYLAARLTGRTVHGAGGALQGRMLEIALRLGVEIWTDAALVDLDMRGGAVVGAHLRREGEDITVAAGRGVIVTAGGFARNLAMRQAYMRAPASIEWTKANPGDTGDAIQAMRRAGAALGWMDEAWWVMTFQAGAETYQIVPELIKPHNMLVDAGGQRFVNEARSYMEVGRACYARNPASRAIPAWVIADSRHRRRYMFGYQPPGRIPEKWIENGWVRRADTIEELAGQCGIDPAGLARSVARFNRFCETGIDEDFHRGDNAYAAYWGDPTARPNPSLGTIAKPPFWAVPLVPGDVGTCGGAITDACARVLREDGGAIDGLYAAGNCAAPLAGPHYIGAGLSLGASTVFGYLAVRHAASG